MGNGKQKWVVTVITKAMEKKCQSWERHETYPAEQIEFMRNFINDLNKQVEEEQDDDGE